MLRKYLFAFTTCLARKRSRSNAQSLGNDTTRAKSTYGEVFSVFNVESEESWSYLTHETFAFVLRGKLNARV